MKPAEVFPSTGSKCTKFVELSVRAETGVIAGHQRNVQRRCGITTGQADTEFRCDVHDGRPPCCQRCASRENSWRRQPHLRIGPERHARPSHLVGVVMLQVGIRGREDTYRRATLACHRRESLQRSRYAVHLRRKRIAEEREADAIEPHDRCAHAGLGSSSKVA